MGGFLVQRLIQTFFVLILVSIMVFLVMRILPGDPVFRPFVQPEFKRTPVLFRYQIRTQLRLPIGGLRSRFTLLTRLGHDETQKVFIVRRFSCVIISMRALIISQHSVQQGNQAPAFWYGNAPSL